MRPVTLGEIRKFSGGAWIGAGADSPEIKITEIATDTRTARGGELFVAIAGERFDGHKFLDAAAGAGCAAALVSRKARLPEGTAGRFAGGLIVVDDTVAALGRLAAWHRRSGRTKVIAVTGSNGKTTVKGMIHHILSRWLHGSCGAKSFNNAIGLPLTLLGAGEGDAYVVCEIGTNAPGEVAELAKIARPDVAVITSVGPTHLERLGSVAKVAREKASLLKYLAKDGLAVVTADSPELDKVLRRSKVHHVRFGLADGAEFRLTGYVALEGGSSASLTTSGSTSLTAGLQRFEVNGRLWVQLPMLGRHNAVNALAAMAVANRFGVAPAEAGAALADFASAPMRMERMELGGVTVINDAYNANPDSVVVAADVLAEQPGGRKVMVVGDMRELGEHADALHGTVGGKIAARGVDLLVCVGELGRYIALGAAGAGLEAVVFDTVDEAGRPEGLPSVLRAGDVVLIKGSRAMGMERLIGPIRAAFGRPGQG